MSDARYYGVSTGDGNNGVSHLFPDYYVKTSDPWRLAVLAALSEFKADGKAWARTNMDIMGEADYTISVVFHESKETQDEREEMVAYRDGLKDQFDGGKESKERLAEIESEIEELDSEIEAFGEDCAWFIVEVFPERNLCGGRPVYESLDEAFGKDVELVATE
jgi:hypothetical protein